MPPKLSELSSLGSVITGSLSHFSPQPISSVRPVSSSVFDAGLNCTPHQLEPT